MLLLHTQMLSMCVSVRANCVEHLVVVLALESNAKFRRRGQTISRIVSKKTEPQVDQN